MLTDGFGEKHYVIAQYHQCHARAQKQFGRPDMALLSMHEAERILLMSFGEDSFTLMKFRFQLLDLYEVLHRQVEALALARELVRTLEKGDIMPPQAVPLRLKVAVC
ncbi:hypothetical protein C5167_045039 [Papaver somniferum]|uniref:Uncharacterized protein n=1 Tax=Papaver somniferum TaxID=3469 RepID=A0A4Y7LAI6_PAPSO|nr:hypothetical protein C5167_045039 [Papaver somniferum]